MAGKVAVFDLLRRLTAIGVLPADSDEQRLRKVVVTSGSLLITAVAPIWWITYAAYGLWAAAAIPFAYQVLVIISLLHLWRTKHFRIFYRAQFTLILVLPVLLQWVLGGFVASSGVILWSFIAPVGALLCLGPRGSVNWFAAFAVAIITSALLEPTLSARAAEIPSFVQIAFFAVGFIAVTGTSFVLLHYFVRSRDEARSQLDATYEQLLMEQARSDRLLLNVLPETIAERLKAGESPIADSVQDASVMFADIVGFTELATQIPANELVSMLDDLYSEFDRLANEFGLEKIKTVGDSYMIVGGIPQPVSDHLDRMLQLALKLPETVANYSARSGHNLVLRIGIDTGPVVAGVIGRQKFSYDLWGDTVNTASRLASFGIPGTIQTTRVVRELMAHGYQFESRGLVDIKGKGHIEVFLVDTRPESARRPSTEPLTLYDSDERRTREPPPRVQPAG